MNYQHIYHAGNFADVAKHVALQFCLDALKRKDSAFFALDTHAGRGGYDLQAAESKKSGEAERGVQRLVQTSLAEPDLAAYFGAIHARGQTIGALSRLSGTHRRGVAAAGSRRLHRTRTGRSASCRAGASLIGPDPL
jgi:23S rRNA (adenine2030-N6)-methyltransferase